MKLYIPNFDFEHRLVGESASKSARRVMAELAWAWMPLIADSDAILFDGDAVFPELPFGLGTPRVVSRPEDVPTAAIEPWGWTDELRRLAETRDPARRIPSHESVRSSNDRMFSFGLEQRLNCGIPFSRRVESMRSIQESLQSLQPGHRWVVKARFGMSARERVCGNGSIIEHAAERWIESRLERDGVVFFEPWVCRVSEAGLHYVISADGTCQFLGTTELVNDAAGRYRGSVFTRESTLDEEWHDARLACETVVASAKSAGYHGPLGIDAMRFQRADESLGLRPIQDINARYTMGRLCFEWRRHLAPGQWGAFLLLRGTQADFRRIASAFQHEQGELTTSVSPTHVADRESRLQAVLAVRNTRERIMSWKDLG